MNKKETLTLLDGSFTSDEAEEILQNIFHAKIHFHETRNLSSQERFGRNDAAAMERIPALRSCMRTVAELVAEASKHKKKLTIHSVVHIEMTDGDQASGHS